MRRMYYEMFCQMRKQLGQLEKWLDSATAFANQKSFDVDVFMGLRLAPDQFAFARHVQVACDTAKLGASRLTGREAPFHSDTEQTFVEHTVPNFFFHLSHVYAILRHNGVSLGKGDYLGPLSLRTP